MQTFLPYPDYYRSCSCLDRQRHGKQRIEARTCAYLSLRRDSIGDFRNILKMSDKEAEYHWKRHRNHPAVKMWSGHVPSLLHYGIICCETWVEKGYRDNMELLLVNLYVELRNKDNCSFINPPWLGNELFHSSHRSNLLRKDPIHYGKFGWKEPNNLPYIWPIN